MSAVLKEKLNLNLKIDQSKRPKSAMVRRSRLDSTDLSDDDQENFLDSLIAKGRVTGESNSQLSAPQVNGLICISCTVYTQSISIMFDTMGDRKQNKI